MHHLYTRETDIWKIFFTLYKSGEVMPLNTCQNLSEAVVVWRCSSKMAFLKISPVSQENTCMLQAFHQFHRKHLCWSHFLIKLQVWRPATLVKRDNNTGVFLVKFQGHYRFCFFSLFFLFCLKKPLHEIKFLSKKKKKKKRLKFYSR